MNTLSLLKRLGMVPFIRLISRWCHDNTYNGISETLNAYSDGSPASKHALWPKDRIASAKILSCLRDYALRYAYARIQCIRMWMVKVLRIGLPSFQHNIGMADYPILSPYPLNSSINWNPFIFPASNLFCKQIPPNGGRMLGTVPNNQPTRNRISPLSQRVGHPFAVGKPG